MNIFDGFVSMFRRNLPKYTKNGFEKLSIPQKLYAFIKQSKVERISEIEKCGVMRNCLTIKNGEVVNSNNSALIGVANIDKFQNILTKSMKEIIENWSNIKLSKEAIVYGIRRYFRGAKLWEHTDRVSTHILSAILQVIWTHLQRCQKLFADRLSKSLKSKKFERSEL